MRKYFWGELESTALIFKEAKHKHSNIVWFANAYDILGVFLNEENFI